jgi:cadmium resistance protein CadD (predicted permease)
MNLAAVLGLAVVVFASTNIDDIFVLLGFLADPHFQLRNVAVGQYLGIGVLVIVSIAASLISLVFAPDHVGLLGLLPVLIGVIKLFTLLRRRDNEDAQHHEARSGSIGQIAAVAAVTIANGGDNVGIYTPLFATETARAAAVIVIAFMILTALWIGVAHLLVSHPTLGATIRRYGHIAAPFVLIGLGIYILHDAGPLQLLRSILGQKS